MKLLFPLLFIASSAIADDLSVKKQAAVDEARKIQVEARLDQAYAGNTNAKQMLDVYVPMKRNGDKPLPVVAFIHGGGWVSGDRFPGGGAIAMARSGDYVGVSVGYRLTKETGWPAQIHDCKAAIRWIRAHAQELNIDGNRIAVWGSSAGAHLASLLGTSGDVKEIEGNLGPHTAQSSRVACVVNRCGPQDLTLSLMFTKDGKPRPNDDAVIGLLGGSYEQKRTEAVAASPVTYASADDPPFIHFHGTDDQRVAFRHGEAIHAALQKAGVTSLLIPITDGGHNSIGHAEVWKRSEQFTARQLRGIESVINPAPIPATKEKK